MASIAALWGAAITFVLLLLIAHMERDRAWRVTLQTSASGVWFAPATILLTASSPIYLAAALALVISATRLLYSQWRLEAPAPAIPPASGVLTAGGLASGFWPRNPGMALSAGLSVQAGLSAWLLGASGIAAALFSMAVAILTVLATSSGLVKEERPSMPQSAFALVLTILLAAGMMVTGLGHGQSGDEAGSGIPKGATNKELTKPANYNLAKGGDFPGVILRPEKRAVPLLVEPIPSHNQFAKRTPDRPFSIPFDGEYWMYRWPFPRPPAGSYIYHGSPTDVSYKTVDDVPLRMDAHQMLDGEIDLSCCSAIEIEILNADPRVGTVAVELLLADRGGRPVSLGERPVISRPDLTRKPVKPVLETLHYGAVAGNFDEIKVSFVRMRMRAGRSARIAINRFLLIPR